MILGLALATLSAIVYGVADFCGGLATRRAAAESVTCTSQLLGLAVLTVGLVLVPGDGPTARAVGFGAMGGLCGAIGLMSLYHALSSGSMSVVSPIAAVVGASLPVLMGVLVLHERTRPLALGGTLLALLAIVLVSSSGAAQGAAALPLRGSVTIAVLAGAGFGGFFVLLERAGDPRHVGLWALAGARPVSITAAGVVAVLRGRPLRVPRPALRLTAAAGLSDQCANVLYVLALGRATLASIAVLASLYPVSTVALARVVLGDRLTPRQGIGVVLAFGGLVLIAM